MNQNLDMFYPTLHRYVTFSNCVSTVGDVFESWEVEGSGLNGLKPLKMKIDCRSPLMESQYKTQKHRKFLFQKRRKY